MREDAQPRLKKSALSQYYVRRCSSRFALLPILHLHILLYVLCSIDLYQMIMTTKVQFQMAKQLEHTGRKLFYLFATTIIEVESDLLNSDYYLLNNK